jgi:DNA repair ATPase RecN
MSYESQLENLKKEIVARHEEVLKGTKHGPENFPALLKDKMEEYESVSEKYNELFNDILQDSVRMKEEYAGLKKDID